MLPKHIPTQNGALPSDKGRTIGRRFCPVTALLAVVLFCYSLLMQGFDGRMKHLFSFGTLSPTHTISGLTELVQWDKYSLIVKGQRIFLWSGEFHQWRLPVPELWPDIFDKVKASGMNAISVYIHWGLSNPAQDVLDFDGFRDVQRLLEDAKAAGLWVVFRPGPYINAETTAGGIPGWVTAEVSSHLRTNATEYRDAWGPYIKAVGEIARRNQITEGGPVIAVQVDNEYAQRDQEGSGHPFKAEMMVQLERAFRQAGIVVPLTFNDAEMGNNYATGKGAVDIYGLDSYPQSFDCSKPYTWKNVTTNYHDYHLQTNPDQPFYIPEFQGGAYDPWGPNAPGYDKCRILTGPDFQSVFNLQLWASNAKLINIYMVYGGTSWGGIPFPGVYTSYDYGAPIRESRELSEKYTEMKRQGLFLRSAVEFYKTDLVGNSTHGAVVVDNPGVFMSYLRNPDTEAGFYISRHSDSTSNSVALFKFTAKTSAGPLELPLTTGAIELTGRQSKMIVTDFKFGSSRALFSTASVLFAGVISGRDVLFLHGSSNQSHEAAVKFTGTPRTVSPLSAGSVSGHNLITILPGVVGLITIYDSDTQLILYADSDTAGTFWSPVIPSSNNGNDKNFANFWSFGTNNTVLVGGPYLVRGAKIEGDELALRGDLNGSAMLTVIAPPDVRSISWNGYPVGANFQAQEGFVTAFVQGRQDVLGIKVPKLTGWKYSNSLPEIEADYSDKLWQTANRTETNSPYKPYYGDGPILHACDYGFCDGTVLWRGHFRGTGQESAVNLTINGGEAFAASVFLNDKFLGTTYGNSSNNMNIIEETVGLFSFPTGAVMRGEDNVITVVQDNMGLNETDNWVADTSKSPRGIRGYSLEGGSFSHWKVQGKLGGYTGFRDRVRGVLNEGGLFGERQGWHLPEFNVTSWTSRDLADGLPHGQAGVGVFRTEFELTIPEGYDVPISFVFDSVEQPYRAWLYVNGWQMGKRVANLGPQFKFPVHEGILNYRGRNTVAVVLWAMESQSVAPTLRLAIDGIYEGGVGPISTHFLDYPERGTRADA